MANFEDYRFASVGSGELSTPRGQPAVRSGPGALAMAIRKAPLMLLSFIALAMACVLAAVYRTQRLNQSAVKVRNDND